MADGDALARDARAVWDAAVAAASAGPLLAHADLDALAGRPLAAFRRVVVVGTGKAALAMATAAEARLAGLDVSGEVTVPHGYPDALPPGLAAPRRVGVRTAGHPVPDAASAAAGRAALDLVRAAGPDDLVLALVSGGGSALWSLPAPGLTADDLADANRVLLASGLPIDAVNTVRRRLSAISGGRLAAATAARVVALVLSDVVGGAAATIASGPTVAAGDAPDAAARLLRAAGAWDALPAAVRARLDGPDDAPAATPNAATVLVGDNRTALEAARAEAERRGYRARVVTDRFEGEARRVGADHARALLAEPGPACLLWGGEATVALGPRVGRGGRNQEAALGAALALDGHAGALLLAAGTDGIDGPTDAAGGWADGHTAPEATRSALDDALADHDSYPLLDRLGRLVRTGPTHTNVMDLHVGLRRAGPA